MTGEKISLPEEEFELELEDLDNAVDTVIEMKNLSELAVDLSYSSLLYRNEDVAHEVIYLEEKLDNLKFELKQWILKSSRKVSDEILKGLVALLELATASENIADAARDIAEIVVEKLELHPIFMEAMKETDEVIVMMEVGKSCDLDGMTLGEAKVETNTGMHVVAVKRDNRWITKPGASTKLSKGDLIIAKGTREGVDLLKNLCSVKVAS